MQNKLPILGSRYCHSFGKPLLNLARFDADPEMNTDPWQIYLQRNINQLQMYNLWHEDRTSSGNSIESRVPYLDHRIIEFIQSVPEPLRKELFWDKNILRKAFSGELPEIFLHREKVPFFYGKDVRYTNKLLYRILSDSDSLLVREVIEDSQLSEIYDRDVLWNTFLQIGKDPSYRGIEIILELVNMGQLQILAREGYTPPNAGFGNHLDEYSLKNWETDAANLELALGQRNTALGGESIIKLCQNVRLVQDRKFSNVCFIAVNNELKYSLDISTKKAWVDVLAQFDGIQNMSAILARLSVEEHQIRKDAEEALEFNVIEIIG
jgi:asparagine synthase (glutamine-hydrolysing)